MRKVGKLKYFEFHFNYEVVVYYLTSSTSVGWSKACIVNKHLGIVK